MPPFLININYDFYNLFSDYLPVFQRTRIMIQDYCFIPRPVATLEYAGPNPQNAFEYIRKLFGSLININEKEVQEREFRWDRSAGKEDFHVRWEVIKDLDTFTFMNLVIVLDGTAKPSKEFGKEGNLRISMEGRIRTEYPQDTVWQRSLIYEMFRTFWHKVVYESTRKKYIEDCRAMMNQFADEMRSFFNVLQKTS